MRPYLLLILLAIGCEQRAPNVSASNDTELNDLLIADLLEWKAQARALAPHYQAASAIMGEMSIAGRYGGASVRKPLRDLQGKISKFTNPYEDYNVQIVQLDSLSAKLYTKRISFGEAKKAHDALRKRWAEVSGQLTAAQADTTAWRSEFDAIFQQANQNAAGGK
jgi:hypothetical protein